MLFDQFGVGSSTAHLSVINPASYLAPAVTPKMGKRKRDQKSTKGIAIPDFQESKLLGNGEHASSQRQRLAKSIPDTKQTISSKLAKTSSSPSPSAKLQGSKVLRTDNHVDVKTEAPVVQIITGSYERVLHGITATVDLNELKPAVRFSDSFMFNAHTSAIRCLALSPLPEEPTQGVYLATGSSDERVNVYSLSASPMPDADTKGRQIPSMPSLGPNRISENPANRELGTLVQHSSNITALHFPTRSKLMSASEDNTISISKVRDLSVISSIKAPRPKSIGQASGDAASIGTTPAGINDFAVHPSMKLMVTVGRGERCMRLWNLVTGKKAGVLNFDREMLVAAKEGKFSHGEGRKIRWNKAGTEFAVAFERSVLVFGQESKVKCVAVPQPLSKVHQIAYFTTGDDFERLVVSTEDGRLLFFDTDEQGKTSEGTTNMREARLSLQLGGKTTGVSGRIKDFTILPLSHFGLSDLYIVITGSSDGSVRTWKVEFSALEKHASIPATVGTLLGTYETGNRITCLSAFVMLPAVDIEGGMSDSEAFTEGEDSDNSDAGSYR